MNSISRSILARSLMTAATLAFMMASAAAVRAQTVIGTVGANGVDCTGTGFCDANAADGESVSSAGDTPTAIGGAGGNGGTDINGDGLTGSGGNGGNATAIGGSSATAIGGTGGRTGSNNAFDGDGGNATATATGPAATATAIGGEVSGPAGESGNGGNATATATAISNGSATSSATATSGAGGFPGGSAKATSSATSTGFGSATASAIATGNFNAIATSSAETAYGGLAQAQAEADFGLSQSTAKTTFEGVSIQSTVSAFFGSTDATAQGGSGQASVTPEQSALAFSTALPNTAYATSLIGSASNVADALLKSDDKIFGTVILESDSAGEIDSSSTLDFSFQGDLILGVVTGGFFDIGANGIDILSESVGDNTVINLGFLGPNIDLTIEGDGVFAIGGAVPEPSTWAMMLAGFTGLGFAGYRRARKPRAA
jgi:PEP-CTERM motif